MRTVTVKVTAKRDGFIHFGTAMAGFVLHCPGEGPSGKQYVANAYGGGPRFKSKCSWHRTREEAIDAVVTAASKAL